jgi:hypothetical protein
LPRRRPTFGTTQRRKIGALRIENRCHSYPTKLPKNKTAKADGPIDTGAVIFAAPTSDGLKQTRRRTGRPAMHRHASNLLQTIRWCRPDKDLRQNLPSNWEPKYYAPRVRSSSVHPRNFEISMNLKRAVGRRPRKLHRQPSTSAAQVFTHMSVAPPNPNSRTTEDRAAAGGLVDPFCRSVL